MCQNFLNDKKRQKFVVILFLKSLRTRGVFGSGRDGVQTELPCPDAGRQQADGHLPCRGAARTHGLERYQQIRPGHAFRVNATKLNHDNFLMYHNLPLRIRTTFPINLSDPIYVLKTTLKICYTKDTASELRTGVDISYYLIFPGCISYIGCGCLLSFESLHSNT